MKFYQYRGIFVNERPRLFELTVLIVVLNSQGHSSQSDDANDSDRYFPEVSFHLRKITDALVAAGDDVKLVRED